MKKSNTQDIIAVPSILPQATGASTSVTGTGVDTTGYNRGSVVATVGVITDGTHALKVQDSADNSSWADVAAGQIEGTQPSGLVTGGGNGGSKTYQWGFTNVRKYVRVVDTVSAPTSGAVICAEIVFDRKYKV